MKSIKERRVVLIRIHYDYRIASYLGEKNSKYAVAAGLGSFAAGSGRLCRLNKAAVPEAEEGIPKHIRLWSVFRVHNS